MPWPVAVFLAYAAVILVGVGLSLSNVVDQAILVPITPLGIVLMALLAYTIFTTTMVLQRKAAGRTLALGLATLAVPAIPLALIYGLAIIAVALAVLAAVLIWGLRTRRVAAWLDQE